jgi:predicted N-acetyltransferase YhbS
MEIRVLEKGDDRSQFHCGDQALDLFFHNYAGQNQFKHHIGTTYVAVESKIIIGFVTVSPGHLDFEGLPAAVKKKLPAYPIPILRLARLAVALLSQKSGCGAQLLRFVLKLALKMSEELGCAGVVADAKPDAIAFYARYGFEALEAVEGISNARPEQMPMLLSWKEIEDGLKKK